MDAIVLSLCCSLNHPTYNDCGQRPWNTTGVPVCRPPAAGGRGSGGRGSGQYTATGCPYGVNSLRFKEYWEKCLCHFSLQAAKYLATPLTIVPTCSGFGGGSLLGHREQAEAKKEVVLRTSNARGEPRRRKPTSVSGFLLFD